LAVGLALVVASLPYWLGEVVVAAVVVPVAVLTGAWMMRVRVAEVVRQAVGLSTALWLATGTPL
jgi:hypothetical protein